LFDHDERDSWELTREGHRALEEIIARFRSRGRNRWEIHKCFLWRTEFKKIIDPSYLPSSRDHKRPPRQRRRPYDATEQTIKLLEKLRMEYLPTGNFVAMMEPLPFGGHNAQIPKAWLVRRVGIVDRESLARYKKSRRRDHQSNNDSVLATITPE